MSKLRELHVIQEVVLMKVYFSLASTGLYQYLTHNSTIINYKHDDIISWHLEPEQLLLFFFYFACSFLYNCLLGFADSCVWNMKKIRHLTKWMTCFDISFQGNKIAKIWTNGRKLSWTAPPFHTPLQIGARNFYLSFCSANAAAAHCTTHCTNCCSVYSLQHQP